MTLVLKGERLKDLETLIGFIRFLDKKEGINSETLNSQIENIIVIGIDPIVTLKFEESDITVHPSNII